MLILASTSDKISVVTNSSADVDVQASFVDYASGVVTLGRSNATINSATTTDIVAAPASGKQRNVKHLSIRNRHASTSQSITLLHTAGATVVELFTAFLNPGEELMYDGEGGFGVYDVRGALAVSGLGGTPGGSFATVDDETRARLNLAILR